MKDNATGVTIKRNNFYVDGERESLQPNRNWINSVV
jgi:hypothetical protein